MKEFWLFTLNGACPDGLIAPDFARIDLPTESKDLQHFLLPFAQSDKEGMSGSVLELLNADAHIFRRIGVFEISYSSSDAMAAVLDRQTGETEYPCEAYDVETLRHTVYRIVSLTIEQT